MIIRSEIIYRLLSTDSEKLNGVSGDTAVGSKTWRNSAAKLQIRSRYGIRQLIWQGDTQY